MHGLVVFGYVGFQETHSVSGMEEKPFIEIGEVRQNGRADFTLQEALFTGFGLGQNLLGVI